MKRSGFTMIELIFVIVILGILAAVAIPRLAATREDAQIAGEVTSAAQAIQNLGAEWTAQGAFTNYTVDMANASVKCFVFQEGAAHDGNVSVGIIAAASDTCPTTVRNAVMTRASSNGIINDDNTSKDYQFGGVSIAQ